MNYPGDLGEDARKSHEKRRVGAWKAVGPVLAADTAKSNVVWATMFHMRCFALTLWLVLLCLQLPNASAAVKDVEIQSKGIILNGRSLGTAGAYERIAGVVHFVVDPKSPWNRKIVDLGLAPVDGDGKVAFSANFYILQPVETSKSNGTALVEVSNRGGKAMLNMFDFAHNSPEPATDEQLGDKFLLNRGFTLVWIGWEFDVPRHPGVLWLQSPIVTDHGQRITGVVRSEWTGNERVETIPLGDRTQSGYPVADQDDKVNALYVRDEVDSARTLIPRSAWRFSDSTHVMMASGFTPGRIYEVVYRATDPAVAGLGFASIRDFISYLKYGGVNAAIGNENRRAQHAVAFGISQDGRFLRTMLYEGFNADEQGRRVFDGVWAHVGGAGRGSFNERFAQPSRDGHPFMNVFYPVDIPPFGTEALLEEDGRSNTAPKLFLSNGSYEYWGRCASLIHTTEDGLHDVKPPAGTRAFFFAGSQHSAGHIPPADLQTRYTPDTVDYRWAMRALLVAMNDWVTKGKEPPQSQIPLIERGELVTLQRLAFPAIPGVSVPSHKREAYRLDFSVQPPEAGPPYPSLVPQVNEDGNELAGIHMPEVAVPLATYTGWNLRRPSIGAPDEMYSMVGSFIPFARTKELRDTNHDPRPSIQERYSSEAVYLNRISAASQELVNQRYLLEEDVSQLRDRAALEWSYVMK